MADIIVDIIQQCRMVAAYLSCLSLSAAFLQE